MVAVTLMQGGGPKCHGKVKQKPSQAIPLPCLGSSRYRMVGGGEVGVGWGESPATGKNVLSQPVPHLSHHPSMPKSLPYGRMPCQKLGMPHMGRMVVVGVGVVAGGALPCLPPHPVPPAMSAHRLRMFCCCRCCRAGRDRIRQRQAYIMRRNRHQPSVPSTRGEYYRETIRYEEVTPSPARRLSVVLYPYSGNASGGGRSICCRQVLVGRL